jgi:transcriptional regulator with XRE-family HTH domain
MHARTPNPVDILVGRNIRIYRLQKGMSQTELGTRIGVSFQQIQKYEQGTNRVGGGRLHQIAASLDVPVSTFFDGAPQVDEKNPTSSPLELISDAYALRLLQAFAEIVDAGTRRSVLEVVEKLAAMSKDKGKAPAKSKAAKAEAREQA